MEAWPADAGGHAHHRDWAERVRRPPAAGRSHSRPSLRLVGAAVAVGLLVAPVALNGAWLAMRRADDPVAAAGPALGADLEVAARMAWGPFRARVSAACAFAAGSAADRRLDMRPGAEVAARA